MRKVKIKKKHVFPLKSKYFRATVHTCIVVVFKKSQAPWAHMQQPLCLRRGTLQNIQWQAIKCDRVLFAVGGGGAVKIFWTGGPSSLLTMRYKSQSSFRFPISSLTWDSKTLALDVIAEELK